MIDTPKRVIQAMMVARRHKEYEAQVAQQAVPYPVWLQSKMQDKKEQWKKESLPGEVLKIHTLTYHSIDWKNDMENILQNDMADILLFCMDETKLDPDTDFVLDYFFRKYPETQIAYADEENWLKPDWSPDTLQSFFYFGNIFAIRTQCLKTNKDEIKTRINKILPKLYRDETFDLAALYEFVLSVLDHCGSAAHINYVLYHGEKTRSWGYEPAYDCLRQNHIHSDPVITPQVEKKVSVIIASKDHPALLSHCIHSIREFTDYRNVQIIVVDNGSNDENRKLIERIRDQAIPEASFEYHYQKMPFNFSRLCNYGAGFATGEFLLFLNDDTEAVQPEWLRKMVSRASKKYVGAVGIKLLYPDRKTIQHAGVTNIHLGPAHKLQIASDLSAHYYGWNRVAVNCAAATGACLLMRREVFEQAGGWDEQLEVAFNDVEFCYRILELGYQNVCCNDTLMLHHESVSRGSDEGKHKLTRLHRERDVLYGLHPTMWNHDPYYNSLLEYDMMDRGFETGNRFSEGRCSAYGTPVQINGQIPAQWHNQVLCSGIEFAGDESLWKAGRAGTGDYYIQGWFYALEVDNSRYKLNLLLRKIPQEQMMTDRTQDTSGDIWKVPFKRCYRPDREENLSFIDHPALSGLSVWINRNALPAGEYLLGYLWEDTCSRQKMYDFTAETIVIS